MAKTIDKAKKLIELISTGVSISNAKSQLSTDEADWDRISSKAYALHLEKERKKRKADKKMPNVATTSNDEIDKILILNDKLASYALTLPALATMHDFEQINSLVNQMPNSEHLVISVIGDITMSPKIRALQKKGRLEHFKVFKEFSNLIDAATLSYYRENYISSYLTLVPVIEGVLLRWLEFEGTGKKPDFEELRKFFKNSHQRQPCPQNAQFYNVYIKACNKILTEHLFKPSENGAAYSNFNRHLAAHLLNNSQFATKENCIRLFLLIDVMTEIYWYETSCVDPRFELKNEDYSLEQNIFESLRVNEFVRSTPEQLLLGKSEN
jgi:hypothetical protein